MKWKEEESSKHYVIQAYHLAETLKLKDLDRLLEGKALVQSSAKLIYEVAESSFFFIFRFGSAVFFNIEPQRQRSIIEKIRMLIGPGPEMIISDEFAVDINPGEKCSVAFEGVVLDRLKLDRIELMALVLAQSTALEYFEQKVEDMIRLTGDIGRSLKTKGELLKGSTETKRFIGQCITTKQDLVASLYLLDKPDITWNDQVLDSLYRDAVDMFEIKDRYKTLDYKLRMIQENLELITELLQHRHANFLEWAIIFLIAVEIFLFTLELFVLK